jgi:hypothetical protein
MPVDEQIIQDLMRRKAYGRRKAEKAVTGVDPYYRIDVNDSGQPGYAIPHSLDMAMRDVQYGNPGAAVLPAAPPPAAPAPVATTRTDPTEGTITLSNQQAEMIGDPHLAGQPVPIDWWGKQVRFLRAEKQAAQTGKAVSVAPMAPGYSEGGRSTAGRGFNAGAGAGVLAMPTTIMPPKPQDYARGPAGAGMGVMQQAQLATNANQAWNPGAAVAPMPQAPPAAQSLTKLSREDEKILDTIFGKTLVGQMGNLLQQIEASPRFKAKDLSGSPKYVAMKTLAGLSPDVRKKRMDEVRAIDAELLEATREQGRLRNDLHAIQTKADKAHDRWQAWKDIHAGMKDDKATYDWGKEKLSKAEVAEKMNEADKVLREHWKEAEDLHKQLRGYRSDVAENLRVPGGIEKRVQDLTDAKVRILRGEPAGGYVTLEEIGRTAGPSQTPAPLPGPAGTTPDGVANISLQQAGLHGQILRELGAATTLEEARQVLSKYPDGTLSPEQEKSVQEYAKGRGWWQ